MIGAGLVLSWVAVALFAPLIAPFAPNATLVPYPEAVDPVRRERERPPRHVLARHRSSRARHPLADHLGVAHRADLRPAGHAVRVHRGQPHGPGGRLPAGLGGRRAVARRRHHPVVPRPRPVRHHHRHVRGVPHQHHLRHHLRERAGHHAHRARAHPRPPEPRVRGRGRDARRQPVADHARRDLAERARDPSSSTPACGWAMSRSPSGSSASSGWVSRPPRPTGEG